MEAEDLITPEELREWVPSVFRTETVTDEEIAVGEEEVYTEYSSGEVTAYELVWYINDVNHEHTEVVMTKGVDTGYTRRYTYGNERLTWDYIGNGGGYTRSNAVSGQYVHDGRGSANMMLERTSLTVQMSHYYTAYGDVTSVMSISSTATTRAPWTGMWDAYRYNAEDYDGATGLSYLRARYLDIDTASFMTADTYLGNIIEPLSLNLYVYVQGNPVRWKDPSGHTKCDINVEATVISLGGAVYWNKEKTAMLVSIGGKPVVVAVGDKHGSYVKDGKMYTSPEWLFAALAYTFDLGRGWTGRVEIHGSGPGFQKHVHIYKGSKHWSQNEDGSDHHGDSRNSPGDPPKSVLKTLKKSEGWDWEQKHSDWISKIDISFDESGTYYFSYPDGYEVAVVNARPNYRLYSSGFSEQQLDDYYSNGTSGNNTKTPTIVLPLPVPMPIPVPVPVPIFP